MILICTVYGHRGILWAEMLRHRKVTFSFTPTNIAACTPQFPFEKTQLLSSVRKYTQSSWAADQVTNRTLL